MALDELVEGAERQPAHLLEPERDGKWSAALPLGRERDIVARSTQALAELIASETRKGSGDIEPAVAAHALMGAQRALAEHVQAAALAGNRGPGLAKIARSAAKRAFTRLETGFGGYAPKRPHPSTPRHSSSDNAPGDLE